VPAARSDPSPRRADALRLGAHMSIAGGMALAVSRAQEVQASALQVFVKSANRWKARALGPLEVDEFRRAASAAGLARHTLAHASYLLNLASPDETLWHRSITALREERERCASLGIPHLVVHPGAHMGSGREQGLARIATALDRVLREGEGRARKGEEEVTILLEITAGAGTTLGATFEEIAFVLDRARCGERLGVCFDTCHALAAGYEFRDRGSYRATFRSLQGSIGVERIRAFHLNDSREGLGSRVDRHAHIGKGQVGLEAFRLILSDPRFRDLPMVLETPKGEDLSEDRMNLAVLRSLVNR